ARYKDGSINDWQVDGNQSIWRYLVADDAGLLWIGSDRFLAAMHIEPGLEKSQTLPLGFLPLNRLDYILTSRGGGYWRLAGGHIRKYPTANVGHEFAPCPWGPVAVSAACEDRDGNLIVGTLGEGVFCFDAEANHTQITQKQGLSHNWVLSLCADREGCIWVGTDSGGSGRGGLNRLKQEVFDVV